MALYSLPDRAKQLAVEIYTRFLGSQGLIFDSADSSNDEMSAILVLKAVGALEEKGTVGSTSFLALSADWQPGGSVPEQFLTDKLRGLLQ